MPLTELSTDDGGARQGGADLWCTYAAVRALAWLGARPKDVAPTADFLRSRQNRDGGFAWQKGLPSDVWATYYCTQALRDMGEPVPDTAALATWLTSTRHPSGGFAMTPGQRPDAWATYYATRTFTEVLATEVPGLDDLRTWLTALQQHGGGLSWYPECETADVRACYYGAMAWRAAFDTQKPPWELPALSLWLNNRQTGRGGFVFDEETHVPCLWATFRAVRALDALGERPARARECAAWIHGRQGGDGAFTRWEDYADADVWACFSAVGALETLGEQVATPDAVAAFVQRCALPEGGFTYRSPHSAGDSLATAALLLRHGRERDAALLAAAETWLHHAHLPYEGGVMYMPGRGAEVRCTLWAVSALSHSGHRPLDEARLRDWLGSLQNRDGGFGYWHGRASDMVSTVSALEIADQLGESGADCLDSHALTKFLDSCEDHAGFRNTPDGRSGCAATAQAARALHLLGQTDRALAAAELVEACVSRLGGYAAQPRGVPDLVNTYQAVSMRRRLGLRVDEESLGRFMAKIRLPDGSYAWSPLGRVGGGPLADALGHCLETADTLPALNL